MKARLLYRIASILIFLFTLGHSLAYPWSDPAWGVDTTAMRSTHFPILGFSRTYWDFYVGSGLTISVFLLLAGILAWQLGSLPKDGPPLFRTTKWALALTFATLAVLNWMFFFTIPIVFAAVIAVCLLIAAAMS